MSAATAKQPLKSKISIQRKAKAKAGKTDSWKGESLIRPWARESALSIFQALSARPVNEIPQLEGKR
jgi:hypothetical protein